MNYYRVIDRDRFKFIFLYFKKIDTDSYENEILRLGGSVWYANINKYNVNELRKAIMELCDHQTVLHIHEYYLSRFIISAAKKQGAKIVAHAHTIKYSESFISGIRNKILCCNMANKMDYLLACSKKAGEVFFGDEVYGTKFQVLNNAIQTEAYEYSNIVREQLRNQLGIKKEEIVIGHVGRFSPAKNHNLIIDIFYELCKYSERYRLVLIGDGILKGDIIKKIERLELNGKVLLLGERNNVNELYNVMDVFLFPSLYEGLGFVVIEAQSNGLPCIVSNAIPEEACLLHNYQICSLKDNPKVWAYTIANCDVNRITGSIKIVDGKGYNIRTEGKKLEKIYSELINNDNRKN